MMAIDPCFLYHPCVLKGPAFMQRPAPNTKLSTAVQTIRRWSVSPRCNLSPRDQAREDALRVQQEILARRRNKKANQEYFNKVNERRRSLEEAIQSRRLKINQGEDPLIAWKKLRAQGKIKDIGYDDPPKGSIPMPMPSFGIPKFDNGERFDLRLPHVEHGYTDENADVMGKMMKFFGFGKKKKEDVSHAKDINKSDEGD